MLRLFTIPALLFCTLGQVFTASAQQDNAPFKFGKEHKNIIRYELSGGLLFGLNHYAVFGYERVTWPHQSFSINGGPIALPKLVAINTDSLHLTHDLKNNGFNLSIDYRFYLGHENRFDAPHGVYIGPYMSYNHFNRSNQWEYNSDDSLVGTHTKLDIFTVGAELGYQFVLWKRLALDFVMIGPGVSNYNMNATITGEISPENKEKLQNALIQLISQKFPGMNYVMADKTLNGNGHLGTWSIGYRYLIHIGFAF
jgi:hypothetical protein